MLFVFLFFAISAILVRFSRKFFFSLFHLSPAVTFPLRLLASFSSLRIARNPRFSPSSLILALFPLRLHTAPNLNPIFHITSRKSYSAAGQEAARRTTLARRNGGTFLSSLCFSLSPFLSLCSPEVKQFRNILPEYGCDLSPLAFLALSPGTPVAMSSRLFDLRGRRNNACTTTVAIPVVSLVVVLRRPRTTIARFSAREKFPFEKGERASKLGSAVKLMIA